MTEEVNRSRIRAEAMALGRPKKAPREPKGSTKKADVVAMWRQAMRSTPPETETPQVGATRSKAAMWRQAMRGDGLR